MNTRNVAMAFGWFALTISQSFGQDGRVLHLSLEEALQRSQSQSYQVQIARSQLSQAEGQNLESWSGFLPHLSVSENYTRSNDPVTVFSLKLKQGIFSQQDFDISGLNRPDGFDNFGTSFQVQQPLVNLDAIYGKSAASLQVKARDEALRHVQEAVGVQVRKSYFGLVLAMENSRTIEEALESARAHRDEAKAAYEQGMATEADLLAAEVRVAELEEQQIIADNAIATASDNLKLLIREESQVEVVPTDSMAAPESLERPPVEADVAIKRADLRALRLQTRAARRNLSMKRGSWFPRLNAFGILERNSSQAFGTEGSLWTFGFQLQWNFFNGLGTFGSSRHAAAQVKEMEIRYEQADEQARLQVRTAQRSVDAAEKRIRVAATAVDQARESLRIVEERFREGLEKTTDLLDKETDLTRATLRLLKARYDYNIALSELRFALGSKQTSN